MQSNALLRDRQCYISIYSGMYLQRGSRKVAYWVYFCLHCQFNIGHKFVTEHMSI